ncbi:MAG TPA: SusC/RagA family TonB-linked outer membrane protein [Bacteroidota bacterium]
MTRRLIVLFGAIALIVGFGRAQDLRITGKVVVQATNNPLPGAIVQVKGTALGTITDINGDFKITVKNRSDAAIVVSFVGYKTVEANVTSSSGPVAVLMAEDILRTSEVVVTGLASSVKRANAANSVATLSAQEIASTPMHTLDGSLSGKFTGISVSQNSGAPGGGISINLRGVTTINGENQPLFIVDGVIIDNTATQSGVNAVTAATGGGNQNFQDNPVNRVADLNPNDIASIEVLKGPSAAAIYGSKASRGVVIITTKGGTPGGQTRVSVTQQFGMNTLLKKLGSRQFNATSAMAAFGQRGLDEFNKGVTVDYEDEMYSQKGFISSTSVGISGGNQTTQFYASGLAQLEQGIIKRTGYDKYAARLNISHQLFEWAHVDVFSNYIRSSSDRGLTNNDNSGATFGVSLAFTPSFIDLRPVNGVYPDHPFNSSNPVQVRDLMTNNELVNRTLVSGKLTLDLVKMDAQSLELITYGGIDSYLQDNTSYFPKSLQFEKSSSQPGTAILGTTTSRVGTFATNAVHNFVTANNTTFRTTIGLQTEARELRNTLTVAKNLIDGQSNVDQGANINVGDNITKENNFGLFAQEEVNLNDRIYLTAGVRGDASSSNGDPDKYFWFPKASASVRLSQYELWDDLSSTIPEFKLRVAYGATGTLPPAGAKYNTLGPASIGGQIGLLPATLRGNRNIEPEKSTEIEAGLDATLLGGDATFEFSYYHRTITDLVLINEVPYSTGYVQEFVNGGKMVTKGFEVALGLDMFRSDDFSWTTKFNFYKTESLIKELNVPAFNTIGFADVLGRYRIEAGKSATQIVGSENGVLTVLGDETPDFQLGWSNTLRWSDWDLSFLFDWKKGGDVINLTRLLSDLGGTTEDLNTAAGQARAAAFGITTNQLVEDGSYIKLREVTIGYTFNKEALGGFFGNAFSSVRFSLAARNLFTITDYSSYDPEVSNFGNRAIGRSIEVTPFPSARSFYFTMNFNY